MSANPYNPTFQKTSYNFEENYPPRTDEIVRLLEELRQEQEETNRMLRIICALLLRSIHVDDGVLGINPTALLLGLDPQRRKRKRYNGTLGGWPL